MAIFTIWKTYERPEVRKKEKLKQIAYSDMPPNPMGGFSGEI